LKSEVTAGVTITGRKNTPGLGGTDTGGRIDQEKRLTIFGVSFFAFLGFGHDGWLRRWVPGWQRSLTACKTCEVLYTHLQENNNPVFAITILLTLFLAKFRISNGGSIWLGRRETPHSRTQLIPAWKKG